MAFELDHDTAVPEVSTAGQLVDGIVGCDKHHELRRRAEPAAVGVGPVHGGGADGERVEPARIVTVSGVPIAAPRPSAAAAEWVTKGSPHA